MEATDNLLLSNMKEECPIEVPPKENKKNTSSQYKQWAACFSATLSMVAVGTVYGWSTTTIPRLTNVNMTDRAVPLTNAEASLVYSITYLGSVIGPFYEAYFSAIYGRKYSLLQTPVFYIVGWILIAFAHNAWYLYVARVIHGIGVGMSYSANPMYVSEIADTNIRGALSTIIAVNVFTGSLLACSVGPYTSYHVLVYVLMSVPVLFVATFVWFPESPYWLATQGRDEDAKRAIGFFKGDVDLSAELAIVKNNIGTDELKINWRDFLLLGKLRNRRALLIVLVLVLGQQFSGNFGTMQYLEKVFQQSNIGIEPHVATIIVMAVSLVFGALSTATVEKAGRRSLLIVSSFGCAVTHIVLGTYFLLEYMQVDMTSINLLPVVDVVAFAIVYQVGMGTMTNILVGELFPPSVKAIAGAIATVFDSVVGFVVMITFDPIMEYYGSKVSYLIYGTSCFVLFIFVFAYVPETKGRTFGQIQDILGTLRPFRVSSDLSCCAGPCTTRPDKPKAQEA